MAEQGIGTLQAVSPAFQPSLPPASAPLCLLEPMSDRFVPETAHQSRHHPSARCPGRVPARAEGTGVISGGSYSRPIALPTPLPNSLPLSPRPDYRGDCWQFTLSVLDIKPSNQPSSARLLHQENSSAGPKGQTHESCRGEAERGAGVVDGRCAGRWGWAAPRQSSGAGAQAVQLGPSSSSPSPGLSPHIPANAPRSRPATVLAMPPTHRSRAPFQGQHVLAVEASHHSAPGTRPPQPGMLQASLLPAAPSLDMVQGLGHMVRRG